MSEVMQSYDMEGERQISDFIYHLHIVTAFNFFLNTSSLLNIRSNFSRVCLRNYTAIELGCFSFRPMYTVLSKPPHGKENTSDAHWVRTGRYPIVLWNQNLKHQHLQQKWKKSQKQKSLTLWCKKNIQLPAFLIKSSLGNWGYGFGVRILPFWRQRNYRLAYKVILHWRIMACHWIQQPCSLRHSSMQDNNSVTLSSRSLSAH